ncbi:MAG: ABC transporter ATP-binding protein [Deltaproteobacteria bacterium]|nr:ABC transporter ATP-binding protein [Deltaproteobacteria bacterium]
METPRPAPASSRCGADNGPILAVRDLSMDFGGLRAVSSVSFRVDEGEIVGIIGPNGAGKTTLFALLSGFLRPTGGEIRFLGKSTAGLRPDRLCHLGIARTFQVVRPFPEMTVFENVKAAAVYGKQGRRPAAQVRQEVAEILDSTGLAPAADQPARSLSLPQRKRLEVARTLATHPEILLLDEVLAGLNPREVQEAIPFLRSLNAVRGITILMIEHNMRAIMGISHRVLVLNFGQLIFDGTPDTAVKDPDVVRAYLGERTDA